MRTSLAFAILLVLLFVSPSRGAVFNFSTGNPDGLIATASRPASPGNIETETADDFILTSHTKLNSATFTGLLVGGATTSDVTRVTVDIYRVFPNDSDALRTITVPTRANSPGDVEIDGRDTIDSNLSFSTTVVSNSFNAANSVVSGIHPSPNQKTGGEGAVTGQEVEFHVTFNGAFDLPADHYFFRPEVDVSSGAFLWLSAPKPIVAPGTPFAPDLQSWTRNESILPDWLRIGTDIVGAPTEGGAAPAFNASFSLQGNTVEAAIPLPTALWPGLGTLVLLLAAKRPMRFVLR